MSGHPDWCPADYRCSLGEHRSTPIVADVAGDRAIITRVRRDGREWAEVRVRLALSDVEPRARWQLATLLRSMGETLGLASRASRRIWRD